ncbi:MAG: WG repeat-containing protein, partial [Bacteroidota bacterium]
MHRHLAPIIAFFLTLSLVACGGEATSNSDHIDQYTGIDTTKDLISAGEMAEMDDLVLIPFRDGPKWGYADTNLSVIIPAQFDDVQHFSENLAVVKRDSMFGVIDKKGRELIPPKFPLITRSACGVFTIKTPAGFIIVNNQGKRVTQKVYQGTFSYTCTEGRIPIMEDGKVGFFDTNGQPVTGFDYTAIYKFQHGVAPVRKGSQASGKWGVIDRNGKEELPYMYETIFPFVSGFGVALKTLDNGDRKWGVIDTLGNTVVPFQFGRISGAFSGNYVVCVEKDPMDIWLAEESGNATAAELENYWYIYNRKGKKTGESADELWDEFSEGLVVIEKDSLFGFADHTGKVVIPCLYDWACGFKEGLAWVGKKGVYGFIDKSGKPAIPFKYKPLDDYV